MKELCSKGGILRTHPHSWLPIQIILVTTHMYLVELLNHSISQYQYKLNYQEPFHFHLSKLYDNLVEQRCQGGSLKVRRLCDCIISAYKNLGSFLYPSFRDHSFQSNYLVGSLSKIWRFWIGHIKGPYTKFCIDNFSSLYPKAWSKPCTRWIPHNVNRLKITSPSRDVGWLFVVCQIHECFNVS